MSGSRYIDQVANPWDEVELGLRVHDEFIAASSIDDFDAWWTFYANHDPAITAPKDLCPCGDRVNSAP
jgi:hypothetical protein